MQKPKVPKPKYPIGLCTGTINFKGCQKSKPIYHKGRKLCLYCNLKRLRQLSVARKIKKGTYIDPTKLNAFYRSFWDSQPNKVCYETGERLGFYHKWHVHHVIEKKPHPEHIFNLDVCVLLSQLQHSLWHGLERKDKERLMPRTFKRLVELETKYNIK